MTSVAQGDSTNLFKKLCRDAIVDANYKETPMERAATLALRIHNDAQNASKYHMEFTNFADIIIGYIATYYYNHRLSLSCVRLQSAGIPPVTKNIVHVLEEIYKLVKKYDITTSTTGSLSSKARKIFSSNSGREKIGRMRNRLSDEHKQQMEALRKPIPPQESGRSNQHLNEPYDDHQNNNVPSSSGSVVQQSPVSPIHSATQRSAQTVVQHATPQTPSSASKPHTNTLSPDAEATDSESVLDTPDLEHHTSAFSSPTRETPPDNITPVDMEIIPRYIDDEASILASDEAWSDDGRVDEERDPRNSQKNMEPGILQDRWGNIHEEDEDENDIASAGSDRRSNATSSGSSQRSSDHYRDTSSPGGTHTPGQNYPSTVQDLLGPLIHRPGRIEIHASGNSEGNQNIIRYIDRDP